MRNSVTISVRLLETEMVRIKAAAAATGVTVSEFVRTAAVNRALNVLVAQAEAREAAKEVQE